MCGMYGFIGVANDPEKILKFFVRLGTLTETRGVHATGYYGLIPNDNGGNNIMYFKQPGPATPFYQRLDFVNQYKDSCPDILIGHNRHATHGDPKDNINNHPFISRRFGFIHNGIVASVKIPDHIPLHSECDSELMFGFFKNLFWNNHKVSSSIKKTMEHFKSAWYACAMVDNKKRKMYLFGNRGDLVYAHLKDYNVIVWASTTNILRTALNEFNIEAKIHEIPGGQLVKMTPDLKVKKRTVFEKEKYYW